MVKPRHTYIIGDQHGGAKAIPEVINKSDFDKELDLLINLGDIVDGWSESFEAVEFWLEFENSCKFKPIFINGNHDYWFRDYLNRGAVNQIWYQHGGKATIDSYIKNGGLLMQEHKSFFNNMVNYYIDDNNRAFVHAGFKNINGLQYEHEKVCILDREMFENAYNKVFISNRPNKIYDEVFIGHSSTSYYSIFEPINVENIWNIDTGAGFNGSLTIMNVDTKEYWQSSKLMDLYPNEKGRR